VNSTDSAFHNDPTIDHFLRPDSKVDSTLQGSLQKFKELETAPYCNKMASSALIHTCATLKGDNEARDSMEDTLNQEKKLFAARFSVCELSDSAARSLVPEACASFITTDLNTKLKGWFAYYSAKGREKSVPRYPGYDQATRQNLDRCVAALQKSPVTGISYSNAKQTGHQWCSIARVDVEKDKLLETHRALTENLAHQNDILHSHAETLRQQMEAFETFGNQLRTFAHDHMDLSEALREVFTDAQESVHNLLEDIGVKLQAKLGESMEAHEAHDTKLKAKVDKFLSEIMNVTAQQSTDLQLARRNDAEELSGRFSYAVELIEQRIIQFSSDMDSASREVAASKLETLEVLQLVKGELAGANGVIGDMRNELQELQDEQAEMRASVKDAKIDVQDLASEVRAVKSYISAFKSFFTGAYDCFLVAASYYLYLIGVGTFLLLLCLGGWPILVSVISRMIKLLTLTSNKLKELAQLFLLVTIDFLSSAMSAAQQWVDWKGALLLILSVAGIAFYSVAVEAPFAYYQRWENRDVSLFEPAHCVVMVVILVVLLCAISKPALAIRESGFLQSGETERYDGKECAV
jgi:predicted  nucleic acid-binding Zn-ribbon protein